ncbi:MAG: translation initiation factor IF-2 subunit alpha [Thermoprotei archaeon]
MSAPHEKRLPNHDELVIATITRTLDKGAYAKLDEYGIEAFIPLTEIASVRIDNITDFIKIGRKYVCKVIRTDPVKGHVDVSIKRVSNSERVSKMIEWKRKQKALKLLELALNDIPDSKKILSELIPKLEERFGDLYSVFEKSVSEGISVLKKAEIQDPIAERIYKIATERIKPKEINIIGEVMLMCFDPDGIEKIKKALLTAKITSEKAGVRITIASKGAPYYRVTFTAHDYKTTETAFQIFQNEICKIMKTLSASSICEFKRIESG